MNTDEIYPESPEEIAEYEAMYKRQREKKKWKEIELPKSKELNLRHHGKIQHATQDLEDGEVVEIEGVGKCRVKEVVKGLVELERLKE